MWVNPDVTQGACKGPDESGGVSDDGQCPWDAQSIYERVNGLGQRNVGESLGTRRTQYTQCQRSRHEC